MLNEAWTPDAPKMIHLDAMLSASSCIISPTARRDGLTVRMVELRRMKYAVVPLGRLSVTSQATIQAEPSGGTRLDEPAQKSGQAASTEVMEARPQGSDCDAGHLFV
jgi:hypothetical protein